MKKFPAWTTAGLGLMLAYPPIILAFDAFLKFVLHDPTITAEVSASMGRRVDVSLYLTLWTVALCLHFVLGWFDGFKPSDPPPADDGDFPELRDLTEEDLALFRELEAEIASKLLAFPPPK